ncbi:LOW QUALITY PROTEIN: Reverse transcriptase, partial [Phytophthora palmivora]
MYYTKHALASVSGETQIIAAAKLSKLKLSDGGFCFFVRTTSEKTARQLTTDWDAFQGHPVEPVILKYKDKVFVAELPSTPPQRSIHIEAEIELTDKTPVVRKQFRLSEDQKDAVRKWTREMLAAKVIRPSKSPFSSPTFCAVGWRIVHDFRAINARLRVPATLIPRKEDIYDAMAKGKLFSALDLLWGFFQVRLRENDVPYTAFSTPDGLFEYLVTPMGLSCSPSAFNRLIQTIFSDQSDFCRAYFDDLFVFTNTESVNDHLTALDKVLARCEKEQLFIKLSKCTFCAEEIPCLGDYIGRQGIRMDPDKIRTIREWPTPRTKRELQSFLGTCVYVLKYCREFASLTAPLTDATRGKSKNERIDLASKQLEVFHELKRRLTSPPVLAHPDSSLPFHVKTDASDYAIGGYLFQLDGDGHEQIIAYGGRKLNTAERMYPTREKELLAALHAMR